MENINVTLITDNSKIHLDFTTLDAKISQALSGQSSDILDLINLKANTSDTETALNSKANSTTTYSKTEVDTALNLKMDKNGTKQLSDENYTTAEKTKLSAILGTNTGDETISTIKTKLGITTLSGSNTGDQDLSNLVSKTLIFWRAIH